VLQTEDHGRDGVLWIGGKNNRGESQVVGETKEENFRMSVINEGNIR